MYPTYQAKLRGNRLEWSDDAPKHIVSDRPLMVYVTIVEDAFQAGRATDRGAAMAAALEQLASAKTLPIDDPVVWERNARQERDSPGGGYVAAREAFLGEIARNLASDGNFVAAWLGGSFGRDEADTFSDLDLVCITTDHAAVDFCAQPWLVAGRTTEARLKLFSLFGEPAVIHENHHNAPPGGAFTFVMYRHTGLVVDWTLLPQTNARRPADTVMLFDRVGIPLASPPAQLSADQRSETAQERLAFFWMMALVTAKYIARGNKIGAVKLLDTLYQIMADLDDLISNVQVSHRRKSEMSLMVEPAEQVSAIRDLSRRAQNASSILLPDEANAVSSPAEELDIWLRMAELAAL